MSWDVQVPGLPPASWVALIAAGVALLVGVMGPFVTARTARRTLDGQRRMATDGRIWAKRSETYEELLDWAGTIRGEVADALKDGLESGDVSTLDELKDRLELPHKVQIGLAAYSSAAVNTAARDFYESLREFEAGARRAIDPPDDYNPAEMTLVIASHREVANRMAQVISDDLHELIGPDYGQPYGPGGPRRRRR